MYDLYEIENPDPIANVHFFKRKQAAPSLSTSTSPADTRKITDPSQLNDPEFQSRLKIHDPGIFKMLKKALDIPEDSSHNRDLKLAAFETCMKTFNDKYTIITNDDIAREKAPLKEAANFPAINNMSITEIQELCAMKDFLE